MSHDTWLREWKLAEVEKGKILCMAQYTFYNKELWPARGLLRLTAVGVKSWEMKEKAEGRWKGETLGYSLPSLPFGLRLWRCPLTEFHGLLSWYSSVRFLMLLIY